MLSKLDKEMVFGRILLENLIRHIMRTHLDAGFVALPELWIRNPLDMIGSIRLLH